MILRGHKIELQVNNKQATYFAKASGTARTAYNWALNEWKNNIKRAAARTRQHSGGN
jgi:putative transposase